MPNFFDPERDHTEGDTPQKEDLKFRNPDFTISDKIEYPRKHSDGTPTIFEEYDSLEGVLDRPINPDKDSIIGLLTPTGEKSFLRILLGDEKLNIIARDEAAGEFVEAEAELARIKEAKNALITRESVALSRLAVARRRLAKLDTNPRSGVKEFTDLLPGISRGVTLRKQLVDSGAIYEGPIWRTIDERTG